MAKGIDFGHSSSPRQPPCRFPTVALIDGNCMGGGTELSCRWTTGIVSKRPQTKIALPEVKIGLLPAWGGTQRLPRLIGVHAAVEMICSGEPIDAAKAVALGFAFDAVPAERLVEEGVRLIDYLVRNRATGSQPQAARAAGRPHRGPGRRSSSRPPKGFIKGKTKGQYPAPLAALKAIREGCNKPLEEGLKAEQEAAMEVVGTPISANLIGVFFMNNAWRATRA